jgi:hypothetical protein
LLIGSHLLIHSSSFLLFFQFVEWQLVLVDRNAEDHEKLLSAFRSSPSFVLLEAALPPSSPVPRIIITDKEHDLSNSDDHPSPTTTTILDDSIILPLRQDPSEVCSASSSSSSTSSSTSFLFLSLLFCFEVLLRFPSHLLTHTLSFSFFLSSQPFSLNEKAQDVFFEPEDLNRTLWALFFAGQVSRQDLQDHVFGSKLVPVEWSQYYQDLALVRFPFPFWLFVLC